MGASATVENVWTANEIASLLRVDVMRVRNALALADVRPVWRVGLVRLFDQQAVDRVRAKLRAIDAKRDRRRFADSVTRRVDRVLALGVR